MPDDGHDEFGDDATSYTSYSQADSASHDTADVVALLASTVHADAASPLLPLLYAAPTLADSSSMRVAQSYILQAAPSPAPPPLLEFAGDSFYDTDDYVNSRSARASDNVEARALTSSSAPAPALAPLLSSSSSSLSAAASAAADPPVFKGDYAAISLVLGDEPFGDASASAAPAAADSPVAAPRSQYARLKTDSEMSDDYADMRAAVKAVPTPVRLTYGTLPIEGGGMYQRLLTDEELAAAGVTKPKLLQYTKLPLEERESLRHSASETDLVRGKKKLDTMARQARANYGGLPTKEDIEKVRRSRTDSDERSPAPPPPPPDEADAQPHKAALSASSPNAFGDSSTSSTRSTAAAAAVPAAAAAVAAPTAASAAAVATKASPVASPVGGARANRLRRVDRRNLPSLSTMTNGTIACECCRSKAFSHKLTLQSGRVMLLCDPCLAAQRSEQARPQAAVPQYGQLPIGALETQRAEALNSMARLEASWGTKPKDAAAVLELTRLQQALTDIEIEIAKRRPAGAPAAEPAEASEPRARVQMYATPKQAEAVVMAANGTTVRLGRASPPPAPPPPPEDTPPAPVSVSDELFVQRYGTLEMAEFQRAKEAAPAPETQKKNKTFIVKPTGSDASKQFAPSLEQLSKSRAAAKPATPLSPRANAPAQPSPRGNAPAATAAAAAPVSTTPPTPAASAPAVAAAPAAAPAVAGRANAAPAAAAPAVTAAAPTRSNAALATSSGATGAPLAASPTRANAAALAASGTAVQPGNYQNLALVAPKQAYGTLTLSSKP